MMGSNQFQREYIEYLQERNTELLNKLTHMKENYENKIFSKDLNKHYLISTLEDVLNVCTVMPQEIDLFFDKMTAAMSMLKNILLRKSEMVQLVDKISRVINPSDNLNGDLIHITEPGVMNDQNVETKTGKKAGTVKVSPMINGHIISTEPKIYLSRISRNFTPVGRNESHRLSPIIEASPNSSAEGSSAGSHVFRELRVPIERLNLNKVSYNYVSEESPKSRFKGPKTWKKSLSSNKRQPETPNALFLDKNDNLSTRTDMEESESRRSDTDPLEGPSWRFDDNSCGESTGFINFRRRKHRFATVFDRDDDFIDLKYCGEKAQEMPEQDVDELYENRETRDRDGDFKFLKRNSDASKDLICESLSDGHDSSSPIPLQNRSRRSRRTTRYCVEESSSENGFSEFEADEKKNGSTPYKKIESYAVKDDSFSDGDDEGNSSLRQSRRRSCRKRISRSLFVSETPPEKTSPTSRRSEEDSQSSSKKKRPDSKPKSNEKDRCANDVYEKEVFVKLEDCMAVKEITKRSQAASPNQKKKGSTSRSKSKSGSPRPLLADNEGRKKRKAAPVNLTEPKLSTKLRRE